MSHRLKKSLLWFVLLTLIAGCVPSMATPIPTLDPNAINTVIVQTAAAASTQTAQALALQPSPTFTITVPPTFTPEATYTPVAPFIFPSVTAMTKRFQYYRVKHDNQLAYYNYRSRTADPAWPVERWGLQTPEVVRLYMALKFTSGTNRTTLSDAWSSYIDKLNDYDKQKIEYVKANNTALFDSAGFPQLESMTMGGNIITLEEVRDGWGRVNTFEPGNADSLSGIDYTTRPDLIHKFVVVGWSRKNESTFFTNPPPGDLYWPLVSDKPVWISLEFLEPFPALPMNITATATQDVKSKPDMKSTSMSELPQGHNVQVIEYYPSGSNVWGRLATGGWIALLYYEKGVRKEWTNWHMDTMPPLPPISQPSQP